MVISEYYKSQLLALHAGRTKWGASAQRWLDDTVRFGERLQAKTVLDYGCGKGLLKVRLEANGFTVCEYDPGIPGKDSPPAIADMVVCLDVLEHVEPDHLEAVLADIKRLSFKGALLVVALYPSGTILPDGRNSHLIVESPEWWVQKIEGVFGPVEREYRSLPTRNPNKAKNVIILRYAVFL